MAARTLLVLALQFAATAAQAHAFGERYDLPVPLWMNLAGGGAVVALSFVIAAWFMKPEIGERSAPPANLLAKPWMRMLAIAPVLLAGRLISVVLFMLAVLSGYFGAADYSRNAAPTIVWVLGWVGIAFVSVLIGNVWLLLNPWLIVFDWADAMSRKLFNHGLQLARPYPNSWGVWPGVILVIGFVWYMLASGVAGDSLMIAYMLMLYSLITWTGMVLFGPIVWTTRAEIFTLLFSTLARFSPTALRVSDREICRRSECPLQETGDCIDCPEAFLRAAPKQREIALRPYGIGLVVRQALPLSMIVLVIQVLALVAFEGFLDTAIWGDFILSLSQADDSNGLHAPALTTVSFVVAIALLFVVFYAVSAMMRAIGYAGTTPRYTTLEVMGLFVLTLVPISVAYHVAHYLYWFYTQLQFVVPAASDPFAFGWNLFGGRDFVPDRAAIPLSVIWHTAIVAIVVGHVLAVYVSHRVALNEFGTRRAAMLSQIPMLILMIAYTMTSLWMLAQPIMG